MLRIISEAPSDQRVELEVDQEIDKFNAYFKSIQTDGLGLTGPERAIIKTFCAYLLGLGPNNPRTSPTERPPSDAPENRR